MRFLIVPNFALPYDQRMVRGLATGLQSVGHQAEALAGPIDDFSLAQACRNGVVDVVIRVNRLRSPKAPLPADVRHVAWLQDIFPETTDNIGERIHDNDIVYVLGDAEALGMNVKLPCFQGCLLTGIDEAALAALPAPKGAEIDFSLCGFIPRPLDRIRHPIADATWYAALIADKLRIFGKSYSARLLSYYVPDDIRQKVVETVEAHYEPLRGNLNIHELSAILRKSAQEAVRQKGRQASLSTADSSHDGEAARPRGAIDRLMSYAVRDYPRMLDRVALVTQILTVSQSVELYGPGWSYHAPFKKFHKGILNNFEDLAAVYGRTRINLANNTHGLGLHSRTLECMAIGGFIFTHASPHDNKPGGMHTAFEPGVHYGMYTPETLRDEALRWLKDEAKRQEAAAKSAAIVRRNHTWRDRANQIVADLSR